MTPLGSNRDRHAIPGQGEIGEKGCAAFLSEPAFEKLPALFEGPGTSGHAPDKVDVDTMKKLRAKGLAPAASGSDAGESLTTRSSTLIPRGVCA